jgi:hypothetical protein
MRRIIALALLAGLVWYGYTKYQSTPDSAIAESVPSTTPRDFATNEAERASPFKCDGRTHCSQMTSCAEATYFIQNCPGTRMDGNNDGVPCERQWCGQ